MRSQAAHLSRGGRRSLEVEIMKNDNDSPAVDKSDEEWRAQLGPERYHVLREAGTERAFTGSLLNLREDGTYVCGGCGAELFDASAKFESHCGWPSFTHPSEQQNVRLLEDFSHGMHRTEVRCAACAGHLGHLFDDGPGPRGTRYCINSLSLDFTKR
jgi:peptide-methionine (R)-S-oxide reductase